MTQPPIRAGTPGMTERLDRFYAWAAPAYSWWARLPPWHRWLDACLPHVVGQVVLEVSFGPGTLLPVLARAHTVFGIDLNRRMCQTANARLKAAGQLAHLNQAKVEALPFKSGSFDCVLNTMAFSGYPDAGLALTELVRVIRPGGRLVLLDFVRDDRLGVVGRGYVALWSVFGDVIRRMDRVFDASGIPYRTQVIGAGGSLQLFLVDKPLV